MEIIIIFYIKLPHFYAICKLVRHIRYTVNSGYYKLAYTQPQEVVVLFTQFDWLLSSRYPCTIHQWTKTKWLPVSFWLQTSKFVY